MNDDALPFEKYSEKRPWGKFEQFSKNQPTTVKIITVNAGEELSLQTHERRAEFWRVLSGQGEVTIGEHKMPAKKGDEFFASLGVPHRIAAGSLSSAGRVPMGPLEVLEISFGDFDEADIVRLEDNYKRASPNTNQQSTTHD